MNTIEYINDLYENMDDEEVFDYDEEKKYQIHTDGNLTYSDYVIEVKHNNELYYFTPSFIKLKYLKEEKKIYEIPTHHDEKIEFIFPLNHEKLIKIPKLENLSYELVHDMIINEAINVAIRYIQTNYINYCFDEVESLRKKNKENSKIFEQMQLTLLELRDNNEELSRKIKYLEKNLSKDNNGLEKFIDPKQKVI